MSSINSTSSNTLRITGMATGMDTDATVKQMMAGENAKLDKMKQDRQYTQWRQDALRDIVKDFRDLRSSYLLIDSSSDTNMIKSGNYSGAKVTTSGTYADAMTATALPGAATGSSTVTVTQIAKSAKIAGEGLNSSSILSGTTAEFELSDWEGKTISFEIDGTIYKTAGITLTDTGSNGIGKEDLQSAINIAIKNAINNTTSTATDLSGKITASVDVTSNTITFNSSSSSSVKVTASTINDVPDLANLKVINPTTATTLADLGMSDTKFSIKIGTTESANIELKSTDTLSEAISKIYNAKSSSTSDTTLYSNIKVGFSELTKSLTIETRNTGLTQSLQIVADPGNDSGETNLANLAKLGLSTDLKQGQDAELEITSPGSTTATTVTKSSNNFTIDNVTYNLTKDPSTVTDGYYTVNLTTSADAQASVDKIKAFLTKYNTLVEKINTKLTEKKNYNYKPLTDSEKEAMEDDDIKTWEDKAKLGILKNDGDLQKILQDMRNGFMSSVKSAGISLSEVGIEGYAGYESVSKPGQFKIDETKLKKALEERGDQVMKLFAASTPTTVLSTPPDGYSGTGWEDKYKYDNTGIFQRIEDIIYAAAQKADGTLLEKAGYTNTVSEFTNTITKQLQAKDKIIEAMNDKIYDKQERYYQMFAKLEAAMNQLNSQQSWLTQQLSG